jgi:hypothetical protein
MMERAGFRNVEVVLSSDQHRGFLCMSGQIGPVPAITCSCTCGAAIMLGCGVGWACHRGLSRRPVAPAAALVSRQPLAALQEKRRS